MSNTRQCQICQRALEGRQRYTCGPACRKAKSRGRGPRLPHKPIGRPPTKRKGQCVPIAITQATGKPFDSILAMLDAERQRQRRRDKAGWHRCEWQPVIEKLGFVELAADKRKLLDAKITPQGVFLAVVAHHMFAVIGGHYLDQAGMIQKYRRRLVSLWALQK